MAKRLTEQLRNLDRTLSELLLLQTMSETELSPSTALTEQEDGQAGAPLEGEKQDQKLDPENDDIGTSALSEDHDVEGASEPTKVSKESQCIIHQKDESTSTDATDSQSEGKEMTSVVIDQLRMKLHEVEQYVKVLKECNSDLRTKMDGLKYAHATLQRRYSKSEYELMQTKKELRKMARLTMSQEGGLRERMEMMNKMHYSFRSLREREMQLERQVFELQELLLEKESAMAEAHEQLYQREIDLYRERSKRTSADDPMIAEIVKQETEKVEFCLLEEMQKSDKLEKKCKLLKEQLEAKSKNEGRMLEGDPHIRQVLDEELKNMKMLLSEKMSAVDDLQKQCEELQQQLAQSKFSGNMEDDPRVKDILQQKTAEIQNMLSTKSDYCNMLENLCYTLETELSATKGGKGLKTRESSADSRKSFSSVLQKMEMLSKEVTELRNCVDYMDSIMKSLEDQVEKLNLVKAEQKSIIVKQQNNVKEMEEQIVMLKEKIENENKTTCMYRDELECVLNTTKSLEERRKQTPHKYERTRGEFQRVHPLLQNEIKILLLELEGARADVSAKERIISDHLMNFEKFYHKFEEEKKSMAIKISALEKHLYDERESSKRLRNDLQEVEHINEDLKEQIEKLEADHNQEERLQRQQELLEHLEKEVAIKRREWELEKILLTKEMDDALIEAQKSSTELKKVVEQYESEHKSFGRSIKVLINLISDKEGELKKSQEQIAQLTNALDKSKKKEENIKKVALSKLQHASSACSEAVEDIQLKDNETNNK